MDIILLFVIQKVFDHFLIFGRVIIEPYQIAFARLAVLLEKHFTIHRRAWITFIPVYNLFELYIFNVKVVLHEAFYFEPCELHRALKGA